MPQYRLQQAATLLGISDDTLRRWIEAGELGASTDSVGRKVVDGAELAAFARGRAVDVPDPSSVSRSQRNGFVGLITEVVANDVMAQVEIQCGPDRVVALISTDAVKELGLVRGALGVAVVKSTDVRIDIPGT